MVLTPDARVIYANDAYASLLAKQKAELEGQELPAVLPGGYNSYVGLLRESIAEAFYTGLEVVRCIPSPTAATAGNLVWKMSCKGARQQDGRELLMHRITVEEAASTEGSALEKAYGLLHEQNKALEHSLQQFRFINEMLPQFIWTALPSGEVDYYNRHWYRYTGINDLAGMHGVRIAHPDEHDEVQGKWQRAVETRSSFSANLRLRRHDGTYRWFLSQAEPLLDEQGNIIKWYGAITDVDDQMTYQKVLEQKSSSFRFLSDLVPHLIWRTDAAGYHNYFNQRWVEYTGYDVERSMGTEMWNDLLHPDDQQRAWAVWEHSLRTGAPYEIEYRFKRASDGMWRWFLARALPLRNVQGEIIQWYGTCTDIEDKKNLEQVQEQQKKKLEVLNSDLDRLIHMIGHDLKLPLLNTGVLLEELTAVLGHESEEVALLMQHLLRSYSVMKSTLEDLLEFAKLQQAAEHQTKVQIDEIIQEVIASLERMAQNNEAAITYTVAGPGTLMVSRANLRSVLQNLVSNGIKYRHPERTPRIEIHTCWSDGFMTIVVKDNGLGMNAGKQVAKLFTPFSRLHKHVEGSGLGLYIVKRIAEAGGGSVSVLSEEGAGTELTVRLKADLP